MKWSAWITLTYALIVMSGGIVGFTQAHSYPSLIAATLSATLLFMGAIGMFRKSILAYTLVVFVHLLLTLFFTYRYAITTKFMPAGLMIILSASSLIFILTKGKKKARLI